MEDLEAPFCVILCQTGHCSEQPLRIKGHWDSPPSPSATEKRAMLQHVGERPELNPYPFVESEKAREAFAVMELKALTTTVIRSLNYRAHLPTAWYHLISRVLGEGAICPKGAPDRQVPAP